MNTYFQILRVRKNTCYVTDYLCALYLLLRIFRGIWLRTFLGTISYCTPRISCSSHDTGRSRINHSQWWHTHILREHVFMGFQKNIIRSLSCDVEASNCVSSAGNLALFIPKCIFFWLSATHNWILSVLLYLLYCLHVTSEIKNRSVKITQTAVFSWLFLTSSYVLFLLRIKKWFSEMQSTIHVPEPRIHLEPLLEKCSL